MGCCNGSSSNFEFYLLLKRLLKSNSFSWEVSSKFPNNFDSLISNESSNNLLNGRFGTKCRSVRNTSLVEDGIIPPQHALITIAFSDELPFGCRVKVYWDDEKKWFFGRCGKVSAKGTRCVVIYDDGDNKSELVCNIVRCGEEETSSFSSSSLILGCRVKVFWDDWEIIFQTLT